MTALVLSVLGASLLGSVHCAGMCGAFMAISGAVPRRQIMTSNLLYSLGRLMTYSMLGALAGSLGSGLDLAGDVIGLGGLASLVAGALIAAWGVGRLLEALGHPLGLGRGRTPLGAWLRAGSRLVMAWPAGARALALGLLSACLPCGWLYAFVVTAAGTGSALAGAATMAVFWLGTLPVMLALGAGLGALLGPLRRALPLASAAALMTVGLLAVAGRAGVPPAPHHAAPAAAPGASAAPAAHAHR